MKRSATLMRAFLAFVAVTVIQMLAGILLIAPTQTAQSPNAPLWLLLSNALAVAALSFIALRSNWRGWRLGAAMAAIPTTVAFADTIEGAFFLTNSAINWPRLFAFTILSWALTMPVWMFLFGRRPDDQPQHYFPIASKARSERIWKFAVSDVAYALLYIVAGTIVFPYVKDFYATQQLPSTPKIFAMQLLVRGPIFIVLCLVLVRMLGLPRLGGALAVGALFALLSGVTPLLIPNPFFADSLRWAHMCEVTSSNFVFGTLVAWLWGQPKLTHEYSLRQAA